MFEKLEIIQMARSMAAHASERHTVIAGNIAHADTPGYHARDIASFSDTFAHNQDSLAMRRSRNGHISETAPVVGLARAFETNDPVSPNGNSVSLETEMVKASAARHQHELALSIFSTSLGILRTSLGRR